MKRCAVDGPPFAEVFDFEVRAAEIRPRRGLPVVPWYCGPARVGGDQIGNDGEVFGVIGLHEPQTVWLYDAGGVRDERRRYQSSLVVSLLGPGIRMVQVQHRQAFVRQVTGNEGSGVDSHHPDIGQLPAGHAIGGVLEELVFPFETDKTNVRVGPSPA